MLDFFGGQKSQKADRVERERAARQALANALLEGDDDNDGEDGGLQARSNSWADFLKGKTRRKKAKNSSVKSNM